MKQILIITIFALTVSCGLDNFSEPRSHLTGKVVYNGSPIGVRHGKVAFDIYQEGYELDEPVKVYIAQDGTFSAMLFDGDYRLVSTDGTAPWANGVAELPVTVRGNTYTELEVEPYYTLDDVKLASRGLPSAAILSPRPGEANRGRSCRCSSGQGRSSMQARIPTSPPATSCRYLWAAFRSISTYRICSPLTRPSTRDCRYK